MSVFEGVLESFHRVLLEEIAAKRPEYLGGPFTVAEIYQDLVPYSTHRDRIGVEINGDYEDALIRLLAGEGGYLILESEHALRELRRELDTSNPNTGVYREFAAVDVRLDPARVARPGKENGTKGDGSRLLTDEAVEPAAEEAPPGSGSQAAPPEGEPAWHPEGTAVPGDGREASADTAPDACRWCRAALPAREALRFCPYCGTDVRTVPCTGCGEEMEPEWRFCIACGTEAPS